MFSDPVFARLLPIALTDRGVILQQYAEALIANLPRHIAERELAVIHKRLAYPGDHLHLQMNTKAMGPGNVVSVIIKSEQVTECFSAFGRRGTPAERVGDEVVIQVQRYINAEVPVGLHLADQLLIPVALAGCGEFVTLKPSMHTTTNMSVISKFMLVSFTTTEIGPDAWRINLN